MEAYQHPLLTYRLSKSERSPKQLKEHYSNYLDPRINRGAWTLEEDLYLVRLLETYGENWAKIERELKGRTQNQIKNRYHGRIKIICKKKKQIKKAKGTFEREL